LGLILGCSADNGGVAEVDGTGETGAEETGTEETGTEETGAEETGAEETGAEETGAEETGTEETGAEETGTEETGAEETGAEETGAEETGAEETGAEETGAEETGEGGGPPPEYLGGDRPAAYILPDNYEDTLEMPLLVLLHGYTGTAVGQDTYFGLSEVTKAEGVMLVMPDGKVNTLGYQYWNATDACCDIFGSGVDDVAYIGGLIEEAITHFNIDEKRVYLVGHSNGGFMSMRMACDRSDLIAGVVNFGGSSWHDPAMCGDPDPVAVLQVHGDWDTVILYNGKAPKAPDSSVTEVDNAGCLNDACGTEFDACVANVECGSYYDCLVDCSQKPGAQACYGECWNAATDTAKLLWMPNFLCGLGAGCYEPDWTIGWPGYAAAPEIVARWAERNGCDAAPEFGGSLDLISEVFGTDTFAAPHQGCPEGVQAELWTITYGSHVPGFNQNWSPAIVDWLKKQSKP
jgi:polyhydroxybutyrate depolymerase